MYIEDMLNRAVISRLTALSKRTVWNTKCSNSSKNSSCVKKLLASTKLIKCAYQSENPSADELEQCTLLDPTRQTLMDTVKTVDGQSQRKLSSLAFEEVSKQQRLRGNSTAKEGRQVKWRSSFPF